MNVIDAIRTKRAVRQFTDQPVPDEAARAILDAGRRAQSSKNTQPWHFVAVRDRETLKQLAQCGDFAGHLSGAALGIALVAPRDPERQDWIMFDLGQAAANMQLAAWELGIGSCIATIYQPDRAKAILHVPADLSLDVAISFGYPAPAAALRAGAGRGGRRPLEDVVHWEIW
jgi:nitroreductase